MAIVEEAIAIGGSRPICPKWQDCPIPGNLPSGHLGRTLGVLTVLAEVGSLSGNIDLRETPPSPVLPPHGLGPDVRTAIVTEGPIWDAAEEFLYHIYLESGYCQPSPRRRVEELHPWSSRSVFHVVLDDSGVVGTIRTIFGRYRDLPIGKFERTDFRHREPMCELSSLAVRPSARSTRVIEHLYRTGWIHAYRNRCQSVVAVIDGWLFDVFRDAYCMPFEQIGKPQYYMGAETIPMAMPLVGSAYDYLCSQRPDFWSYVLEAIEGHEIAAWDLPIVLPNGEMQPSQQVLQPTSTSA